MATKLKDLKITKVDFVDKGANPKANIMLYKNESGKPGGEPSHEEHPKHENVLKRFVAAIGKIAGMKPEEIDATVEVIEKGGAETFGEKHKPLSVFRYIKENIETENTEITE